MDPPSTTELGNKVKVRMVGSERNRFLHPHPEQNAMACDASSGCNVGKKAIVVAGGKLDIRGLEDDTCPGWTKLNSKLDPLGVSPVTGCAFDHDLMVAADGTFESYAVGTNDPVGRHHAGVGTVAEEDGNKYLQQPASSSRLTSIPQE